MTAATTTFLPGLVERRRLIRGTAMRWFEGGEGPPLVLLHGFGGAATNWTLVAPRLLPLGRVLVPDLPGHGGSTALPAPAETLDSFADRVAELLDAPAVLVGHSLGGVVALRLASRHPELVRELVLAGCAGISSSTRRSERALTLVALLKPGRRVSRWRRTIARTPMLRTLVFGAVSAADPRSFPEAAGNGFLAGSALYTDVGSAGDALVRSDPRLDLERIKCPALVLHGTRDMQVPLRDAYEYARRLRAPLRAIADCGHLVIGERPDAVVDAIASCAQRATGSSRSISSRRR
jgi:pimeloyl-ACP methyl ester carboxylesterase